MNVVAPKAAVSTAVGQFLPFGAGNRNERRTLPLPGWRKGTDRSDLGTGAARLGLHNRGDHCTARSCRSLLGAYGLLEFTAEEAIDKIYVDLVVDRAGVVASWMVQPPISGAELARKVRALAANSGYKISASDSHTEALLGRRQHIAVGKLTGHELDKHDTYVYEFGVGSQVYSGRSGPPAGHLRVGEKIDVYYDPRDPNRNSLFSFDRIGASSSAALPIVLALAIAALCGEIWIRKHRRLSN